MTGQPLKIGVSDRRDNAVAGVHILQIDGDLFPKFMRKSRPIDGDLFPKFMRKSRHFWIIFV